ncbi:hypothetical protein NMY22_g17072 [Coprinellus aureogranulatus]|nr:hypothetical protein NMY22_g17072 [Coprinellus aureogranulatus]
MRPRLPPPYTPPDDHCLTLTQISCRPVHLSPVPHDPARTTILHSVSPQDVVDLKSKLTFWRDKMIAHALHGSPKYLSSSIWLLPAQLRALCCKAQRIAGERKVTPAFIQELVSLQILSEDRMESLAVSLAEWREECILLESVRLRQMCLGDDPPSPST